MCPECERENYYFAGHYANCSLYVPLRQAANQCECGTYWCTRNHDEEAAWAAHGREF